MKVAILIDVHLERMDVLNQRIEDAVNSVDGRLIYRVQSRYPIRLVCAEEDKYGPSHTSLPFSPGKGVKNEGNYANPEVRFAGPLVCLDDDGPERHFAGQRNRRDGCNGMDRPYYRGCHSVYHRGRIDADVLGRTNGLRQRDNRPDCNGHPHAGADLAFGRAVALARIHVAPKGAEPNVNGQTAGDFLISSGHFLTEVVGF